MCSNRSRVFPVFFVFLAIAFQIPFNENPLGLEAQGVRVLRRKLSLGELGSAAGGFQAVLLALTPKKSPIFKACGSY